MMRFRDTPRNGDEKEWLETIQKFLTRENVNMPIDYYYAPTHLHIAAKCNYVAAVVWLVKECGANVEERDYTNETPLCDAVRHQNVEIVRKLLSYGANVEVSNAQLNVLKFVLTLRVQSYDEIYNETEITIIRLLLDCGASLDGFSDDYIVPHWANKLVLNRKMCRQVCVVMLGIRKYRHSMLNANVKDVICVIAKCVWRKRLAWGDLL